MKISIITVCLNEQDTIEDTFLSIFNQTYENFELIVIDGSSTDDTIEIINKYKDKISHFVSEPDNGIYNAMNKGIKAANGDFLIFLNANDVFYDEYVLEKIAKASIESPEAKILFGDSDYISIDKRDSKIKKIDNIKNEFSLAFENICHQSVFYHKSLFEKFGNYCEKLKIYADWDFNINCLVKNKVSALYLDIVISKFQLGGICSSPKNKNVCKTERECLLKKYYPKFAALITIHDFCERKLGTIYKFLLKISSIQKVADSFTNQDKYKLNLVIRERS